MQKACKLSFVQEVITIFHSVSTTHKVPVHNESENYVRTVHNLHTAIRLPPETVRLTADLLVLGLGFSAIRFQEPPECYQSSILPWKASSIRSISSNALFVVSRSVNSKWTRPQPKRVKSSQATIAKPLVVHVLQNLPH